MTRCRFAILSASLFAGLSALLSAQAPQVRHPAASNPHLGNKESIRGGMALYRVRCADCHGLDGTGYRGPDLVAALGGGLPDERLFDTIRKGVPGTEMPAATPIDVSDDDILQLMSYLKSIGLPKDTIIEVSGHFDNSLNNPHNPDATAEVRYGEQTWEEMLNGFMEVAMEPVADAPPVLGKAPVVSSPIVVPAAN